SLQTGGISAESRSNAIAFDAIPKDGGNLFSGGLVVMGSRPGFQGANLTDSLRARGLTTASELDHLFDFSATLGGPIKRDRLWFFFAQRNTGTKSYLPGNYYNLTQHSVFYTPDLSRPAYLDDSFRSHSLRLNWQAAAKHKVNIFSSYQDSCTCPTLSLL